MRLVPYPNIGSAIAHSDYAEDVTRFTLFCRSAEIDFQRLAEPRNVSVDLKYDVQILYSGWNCILQTYIERATALSDIHKIVLVHIDIMMKYMKICGLCC